MCMVGHFETTWGFKIHPEITWFARRTLNTIVPGRAFSPTCRHASDRAP
jgi:hypothetical protein